MIPEIFRCFFDRLHVHFHVQVNVQSHHDSIAAWWVHINCEQHSYDFQIQFGRKLYLLGGCFAIHLKTPSFSQFSVGKTDQKSLFNQHPIEVQEQTSFTMSDHAIKPSPLISLSMQPSVEFQCLAFIMGI